MSNYIKKLLFVIINSKQKNYLALDNYFLFTRIILTAPPVIFSALFAIRNFNGFCRTILSGWLNLNSVEHSLVKITFSRGIQGADKNTLSVIKSVIFTNFCKRAIKNSSDNSFCGVLLLM